MDIEDLIKNDVFYFCKETKNLKKEELENIITRMLDKFFSEKKLVLK